MHIRKRFAVVTLVIFIFENGAWALQDPTLSPSEKPIVDCENFCDKFSRAYGDIPGFNPLKEGESISQSTWGNSADQLCADVGQPTTTAYAPIDTSLGSPSIECNTGTQTITPGIQNIIGKDITPTASQHCGLLGEVRDRCLYHNSSVEKYCKAYLATSTGKLGGVIAMNAVLLSADATVSAICWAACAFPAPNLALACSVASFAEGAAELIAVAATQSNNVQSYINQTNEAIKYLQYASLGAGALGVVGGSAGIGTKIGGKTKSVIKNGAAQAVADEQKTEKGMSCATATLFTIMTGIRAASLALTVESKNNACKTVSDHLGAGGSATNTGIGSGSSSSSSSSSSSGGGTGGFSNGGGGGGTSSSLLANSGTGQDLVDCMKKNGGSLAACSNGQTSYGGAVDANLIREPNKIGPILEKIPNVNDFMNKTLSEGSGAALGSLLPSSLGSDVNSAIMGLAQSAQNDSEKLNSSFNVPSAYTGGGGGGGGAKNDNPFNGLFNNNEGNLEANNRGPASVSTFGNVNEPADIWHANSKKTLFDIVSDRVLRVTDRVQ